MSSLRQDVNVGLIVFVGVVGAMVLLILALGVQGWFAYESDRILEERYQTDNNVELLSLKREQYANIGDDVGNGTVYASEIELPPSYVRQVTETQTERVPYVENDGYRFAGDDRRQLTLPIHVAMAAYANQVGGGDVTAEQMEDADRRYVTLVNDAYVDPQSYVEPAAAPTAAPATRPSASVGQSAADAR